jgi:hypothetical protein
VAAIPGIFVERHLCERQQQSDQHVGDGEHRMAVTSDH